MIPLQLSISNFLSYRQTAVIDFRAIHLACISGANGAGKSTILDAMTWALFGESRSRSDDDLVNRIAAGENETAEVLFAFDIDAAVYRVIRRKRARKAVEVEFQQSVTGALDGPWKTMTEGKTRDTQAAIGNLLRMDFNIFSNASFILQGRADEFTTKTPDQRKQVLADILGVKQWDAYKDVATERRKSAETRVALFRGQLEEVEAELGEEEARKAALAQAAAHEKALREALSVQEAQLEELRRRKAMADHQARIVHQMGDSLNRAKAELERVETALARRRGEQAGYEAILAEETEIAARYAAWQTTERDYAACQEQAERHNALLNQKRPHELALAQERTRLEGLERQLAEQARTVESAATERAALEAQLAADRKLLAEKTAEAEALAGQVDEYYTLSAELKTLQSSVKQASGERELVARRVKQAAGLDVERNDHALELEAAQITLDQYTADLERLSEQQQEASALEVEISGIEAEQKQLKLLMDAKVGQINRLREETSPNCPVCGQDLTDDHRHEMIERWTAEGTELGGTYRGLKAEADGLRHKQVTLADALKKRKRVEADLSAAQSNFHSLKARLADIERRIEDRNTGEDAARLAELDALLAAAGRIPELEARVAVLTSAVAGKTMVERQCQEVQTRITRAESRLEQIASALATWEASGKAQWAAVRGQLERDDFAAEPRGCLADLDAQIAAVGFDAARYAALREQRLVLAGAERRYQELEAARVQVKALGDALEELIERREGQSAEVAAQTLQHQEAVNHLQSLQVGLDDLYGLEDEVNRKREVVVEASRVTGSAQRRVDVLGDLRVKRKQLTAERDEAALLAGRLKRLEEAFGRKGVQAWLIDQALPEIQDHANELLDRLTGGSMRVSFSTQKALKSRDGMAETLDIKISDGLGERPYENYSGGEKFRVNFAIRLALSQVLARRAGASLKTLVIDEGFGTQDPEGRQRLVEAINAVQKDFACILVITHVDELRDAFPSRIEVAKSVAGSRLTVVAA